MFLCTKLQGCRCPPAPTWRPAGGRGGTKTRWDDHKTTKGTEQREEKNGKGSERTPVLKDLEKRCGFCFYKRKKKTLPSVFCSSYKGLSKRARPPLHHASALVCSSHPVRWRVPPEKPSLLHPHTVVLKKRKPSYNESGLLQANRGLRGRGWRDGVGRWSGKEREEFGERIQG